MGWYLDLVACEKGPLGPPVASDTNVDLSSYTHNGQITQIQMVTVGNQHPQIVRYVYVWKLIINLQSFFHMIVNMSNKRSPHDLSLSMEIFKM